MKEHWQYEKFCSERKIVRLFFFNSNTCTQAQHNKGTSKRANTLVEKLGRIKSNKTK